MPYNVIILTSTVIALGFGSIFNMLVRKFVLLEEVPVSPLKAKVVLLKAKIDGLLGKKKTGDADSPDASGSATHSSSVDTKYTDAVSEPTSDGPRLRSVKT
jgi:phosphatidylinositol glycan class T